MIESVLIANRGEIAVRIIRTAREMGLRTIAVYSEIDRDSLHTLLADESWNIGGAAAADSYLNAERILQVAAESKAAAIHPGYGFLAENAGFAEAVTDAGLVWVGPPAAAIATMGDKIASRKAAEAAGVAGVPGTNEATTDPADVHAFAAEYGYPVALKAAHGGGGKGMRIVRSDDEVAAALEAAAREATAYFGQGDIYMERYLERPRHIEAQIIFDTHEHGFFLGERDCSSQRRHQKLIEEAPAAGVGDDLRDAIGEAALAVGAACGYVNAGTVEFLLEPDGAFYFLEMNTRLQVEHPVTEMVTGLDLVKLQLEVASGEELALWDVPINGHAIEMRINAEDPGRGFQPSPGRITAYREPGGFGVRVDSFVEAGAAISPYYDNLAAKLVVWAPTRDEAIDKALRAVADFEIKGIPTTLQAHPLLLDHELFRTGRHYTKFVEDTVDFSGVDGEGGPALPEDEATTVREATVEVGGRRYDVKLWFPEGQLAGSAPRRRPPRLERGRATGDDGGVITAPMQGTIVKVSVKAGERVKAGDTICILEAMKMENEIKAPVEGEVVDLRVQAGDSVANGAILAMVRG
ncbi:MAG: biotin/lipoyl-binding protein [Acidimicrobiia bacterium]|nr:biotin/lipoyl-binding protein [Acidimicrobiia bacterium]NNL69632.1 biotin/lipoyl-binding protein [Acidimicrobiia bacterium]